MAHLQSFTTDPMGIEYSVQIEKSIPRKCSFCSSFLFLLRQVQNLLLLLHICLERVHTMQFNISTNTSSKQFFLSFPSSAFPLLPIFSSSDKFETCCLCCPSSRSSHLQLDHDKNDNVDSTPGSFNFGCWQNLTFLLRIILSV